MKLGKYKKRYTIVPAMAVLALVLMNLLFPLLSGKDGTEAYAATFNSNTAKRLWAAKQESLGWLTVQKAVPGYDDWNNTSLLAPTTEIWQDTSSLLAYRIDIDSADDSGTIAVSDQISGAVGQRIEIGTVTGGGDGTQVGAISDYLMEDGTVFDHASSGFESGEREYTTTSAGKLVITHTYKPKALDDVENNEIALYYTVEYDDALGGYYRKYYVGTADQLAVLLYYYQTDFSEKLKAVSGQGRDTTGKVVSKLAIELLCDIDLGGAQGMDWIGYANTSVYLELCGSGYHLYNFYFDPVKPYQETYASGTYTENGDGTYTINSDASAPTTVLAGYFLRSDRKFAIHDVTFSNAYIPHANGMFGTGVQYAYFNNVNWEHCMAVDNETGAAIVLGYSYLYCYFKDCTIDNSYVYGKAHAALFASYNGGLKYDPSRIYTYLGDTDPGSAAAYYYTEIPSAGEGLDLVEAVEQVWNGSKITYERAQITLSTVFPSIYEDCATVNSEVYDVGSNHSGTFISCMQSGIIFKNCFSNCTIYAQTMLGVFVGSVIGSGDGFFYPYNGEKTFVNSYFENCYTSGSIEGATDLGGFAGNIFNDSRAYDPTIASTPATAYRGKAVFKNCYSTSSVGMQYAGSYVGGFVGRVVGNIQGYDENDPSAVRHTFENCYAAGEVGGITTDTSIASGNTNSIGGFMGMYVNYKKEAKGNSPSPASNYVVPVAEENNAVSMINCCYDMQTTAMRERDIGNYSSSLSLNHSLDELEECSLTGVYTLSSENKGIQGLADTPGIMDGGSGESDTQEESAWQYETNYYPQLASLTVKPDPEDYDMEDPVSAMKYNRRMMYYYYSLASTATVLLDHYNTVLSETGEEVAAAESDAAVYDTVRDITRKFEFTSTASDGESAVIWNTDGERNTQNGFVATLGKPSDGGNPYNIALTYTKDDGIAEADSYTIAYAPSVLTISEVDGIYKCLDFAPGKQWVKVRVGSSDLNGSLDETADSVGSRNLRLLPTAYLNAGGIININVQAPETEEAAEIGYTNTVTLNIQDKDGNSSTLNLSRFNHSVGVAYAITDKMRMGTDAVYSAQKLTEYSPSEKSDTASFALYGGYLLEGDSSKIYLTAGEGSSMWDQKFDVTQDNNSTSGSTMVRVFTTKIEHMDPDDETSSFSLAMGDEIQYTSENLAKWQGDTPFETEDAGYYYMVYYWRLNDGRYLSDTKLVRITASDYKVELVTGILGQEHTISTSEASDGSKTADTAIDQYVGVYSDTQSWSRDYPVRKEDFVTDDGYNTDKYYDSYNELVYYGDDLYYTKSVSDTLASNRNAVAGWKRSMDYKLVTLIIEAQDASGNWHEMALVDGSRDEISFENAEYTYTFTGYSVSQDPETKLFRVEQNGYSTKTFRVESDTLSTEISVDGVSRYIIFSFDSDGDEFTAVENNLRITALFREYNADVQAEKYVLLGEGTDGDNTGNTDAISMEERDRDLEVDNAKLEETEEEKRKAVLSGDILTYRIRLENIGYLDASTVNVADTVPDNCTYRKGTMKIYKQEKVISADSETIYYKAPEEISVTDIESSYAASYSMTEPTEDNGWNLAWYISSVSMDCDYYVEYQVTVDELSPAEEKRLLENTATWNFLSLNGDVTEDGESGTHSIAKYMKYFIFFMKTNTLNTYGDGTEYRQFLINFQRNSATDADLDYENIEFQYSFPKGFTYDRAKEIMLYKLTYDEDKKEVLTKVAKLSEDGEAVYYDENGDITDTGQQDILIQMKDGTIVIKIDEMTASDIYRVEFYGTQQSLGYGEQNVQEIETTAKIVYTAENNDTESVLLGSSVTKTERITNQVETDVTHLYLNVEKTIEAYDPFQTFLFRIDRYADEDTAQDTNAQPLETYYTQLNCTQKTEDGSAGYAYQGSRIVQVDKRGYYVVTEVTGWSGTDYEFGNVSAADVSAYWDSEGTRSRKNGRMSVDSASAGFALPRQQYVSRAFPIGMGILDKKAYPVIGFTNSESIFAYLSGQSYAENAMIWQDAAEGGESP